MLYQSFLPDFQHKILLYDRMLAQYFIYIFNR